MPTFVHFSARLLRAISAGRRRFSPSVKTATGAFALWGSIGCCNGVACSLRSRAEEKEKQTVETNSDVPNPFGPEVEKYWKKRHTYFQLFDHGIAVDKEGLYSVAPEVDALRLGFDIPNGKTYVLDAFCGVGGNAIGLARAGKTVVTVDNCLERLEKARHNAKLYGVENRIEFVHSDVENFLANTSRTFDAIHFDPPWGGVSYSKQAHSFKWSSFGIDGKHLVSLAVENGCKHIAFRVPVSFDLNELQKVGPGIWDFDVKKMLSKKEGSSLVEESYWVVHMRPSIG